MGVASLGLGIGGIFLAECPSKWSKLLAQWGLLASIAAGVLLLAIGLD